MLREDYPGSSALAQLAGGTGQRNTDTTKCPDWEDTGRAEVPLEEASYRWLRCCEGGLNLWGKNIGFTLEDQLIHL